MKYIVEVTFSDAKDSPAMLEEESFARALSTKIAFVNYGAEAEIITVDVPVTDIV